MAIAFDANSAHQAYSAGTTASQTHVVTGANPYLFVAICQHTANSVSAVSYNSVAMTQIGTTINISGTIYLSMYYLANPSTGSHSISITKGNGDTISVGAASYNGVRPSAPEVTTSSTGSGTSASHAIVPISDNSWAVMGVAGAAGGTESNGGNFTIRASNFVDGTVGDSGNITPAASTTQTDTLNTSQAWALIQATIIPPVAFTLTATQAAYTLTGKAVSLAYGRNLTATQASYSLTMEAATFTQVRLWIDQAKSATTFANGSPHSSAWSNQSEHSSAFTNGTKH